VPAADRPPNPADASPDTTGIEAMAIETAAAPVSRAEEWRRRAEAGLAEATRRIPLVGLIVAAGQRERETGGGLLAGGVAYRVFFWIVPLGLAVACAASLLGIGTTADLETAASSRGLAGLVAAAQMEALDPADSGRWYLLALGVGFSLWFGIGVVRSLAIVYALAWGEPVPKLRRPIAAGAYFTVIATSLSLAAGALNRALAAIGFGGLALVIAMVLVYGGSAFFITTYLPHGDAPRRALVPGCLLIAACGVGLQVYVDVYLAPRIGRSMSTYGMLGAATVILLWLYIIARAITVAAFLNATLWGASDPRRAAPAPPEAAAVRSGPVVTPRPPRPENP
jgi:uncharacterized BrkB/YihY/UPF0761 family membrane protein